MRNLTQSVLVFFLVLLAVSAGGSAVGRFRVAGAQQELGSRLIPAQTATDELAKAYVDQETGQRGYLLTGSADYLKPYHDGSAVVGARIARLRNLLSQDPRALRVLESVEQAGQDWTQHAAEPEITARQAGVIPLDQMLSMTADGKTKFDLLRSRLNDLATTVTELVTRQLDRIARSQLVANVINGSALLLAIVVSLLSVPVSRRLITVPLERLVTQVKEVADGDRERPIELPGPAEYTDLARAVEKMRASLVVSSRELLLVRQTMAVNDERARMAADLQERTIQQVFALGLTISSAAAREPDRAQTLLPFVEETDRIIREVRALIFDLATPPRLLDTE